MEADKLKLKSITISGMHNTLTRTVEFNGVDYITGPNGIGKSTILQSVQLAILGYIPGYSKTNESIMKHASGNIMSVEATLVNDDNNGKIVITRTWMRSGSSVKTIVNVDPFGASIDNLIGELELPIFNFNEFNSLTANKLKEWFISFLPDSSSSIDWNSKLTEIKNPEIITSEELEDVLNFINQSNSKGVDLVKELNAKLKSDQTFLKNQISRIEGTIASMVHYDDINSENNADAVDEEINQISELITKLNAWEAQEASLAKLKESINELEQECRYASKAEDPEYRELSEKAAKVNDSLSNLKSKLSDVSSHINEIVNEIMIIPKIDASGVCPYLQIPCDAITNAVNNNNLKRSKLEEAKNLVEAEKHDVEIQIRQRNKELTELSSSISRIDNKYSRLNSLKAQLPDELLKPTETSMAELNSKYLELQDKAKKIAANKQYDTLMDNLVKDKFKYINELEVCKQWIKLTDANGLQNDLMSKPFEDLSSKMSQYLAKMLNDDDAEARFNLSGKANSFSYGLIRDGKYIEFDLLSSGEKCLYMLALMMCLIENSNCSLKLIMIDDFLDHLDSNNADSVFKTLKSIDNIQFILAGVVSCRVSELQYRLSN